MIRALQPEQVNEILENILIVTKTLANPIFVENLMVSTSKRAFLMLASKMHGLILMVISKILKVISRVAIIVRQRKEWVAILIC